MHTLVETKDQARLAAPNYTDSLYVAAYHASATLMLADDANIPSGFLGSCYRNWCATNKLEPIYELADGWRSCTAGYLDKHFNIFFEQSGHMPDAGKVWGIGNAPQPLIPERRPATRHDLEVLQLAWQGGCSVPRHFLLPGEEPTRDAARQALDSVATGRIRLLQYKPGDDGVSAQESARALLQLAGPPASEGS
mmetsp:Transcript_42542/g.112001  ORF Transcript_42542/g.112001 Transcript_42542/m.112001 type:complete len:194 (+) Transcript_42542:122-703(+)